MFKSFGNERLTEWRQFRQQLEVSDNPLQDVVDFWGNAPFVNRYLNPDNPKTWPDPWHLILDDKYDDLGVALGMYYTVKLTQRFMNAYCEIHSSMLSSDRDPRFVLLIDNCALNWEYKTVVNTENLPEARTTRILWAGTGLL